MTKHTGRRILSLVLAVTMTFSMGLTSAFAASNPPTGGGSGGVIDSGVVDTGHIHTKECFEVSISYRSIYENGRKAVSIDTTEENAKSDYFRIHIIRSNKCPAGQAIPACTAVEVTGELAAALKAESPFKEDYGCESDIYYFCRLSLTDKTKLKDSETVPLKFTVGGFTYDVGLALYAEANDPIYKKDGTAEFTIDVNDIKESYTSTPVTLVVPGDIRQIDKVEIVNDYDKDYFDIIKSADGKSITFKAKKYNGNVEIYHGSIPVKVSFNPMPKTTPIVMNINIAANLANTDVLTASYTKELKIPNENSTMVTLAVNEAYKDKIKLSYGGPKIENLKSKNHGFYSSFSRIYASRADTATFDIRSDVEIDVTGLKGSTNCRVKNNSISATGESKRKVYMQFKDNNSIIDLNDLNTFKKDLVITKYDDAFKIKSVTIDGADAGKFNFTVSEDDAKGNRTATLELKNDASVELDDEYLDFTWIITLESVDGKNTVTIHAGRSVQLKAIAALPVVTAYKYGTNEAVTKDTMAVGESRKYTIKSTNIAKGIRHDIYEDDEDYITIIRGDVFYEGSAVEETITLR
ncbi:MAG: hypothetical protein RSC64_06190, partial [Hydrogenoanaerobacterium sp.]